MANQTSGEQGVAEVNTNDFLEGYNKFLQEEDLPTQPPTTEVKPPVEKPIQQTHWSLPIQ